MGLYPELFPGSAQPHNRDTAGRPRRHGVSRPSAPALGLAYVQGSTNVNIWRLDLLASPSQARKLVISTRSQTGPSISPDGSMIAFESTRSGGSSEVWEYAMPMARMHNNSRISGSHGQPVRRWSPDGKLLAFDSRAGGEAKPFGLSIPAAAFPIN